MAEMRKTRNFISVPRVNRRWLSTWQRDYGVCFRKPNKRYTCSIEKLSKRCLAMWRNVYFARALAATIFGHDLPIFGLDQTPFFMNETGSRNAPSLEVAGAPSVALRENHSQTRTRYSVLTSVTSDRDAALQPGGLPTEVLFKGKTNKIVRDLEVPEGVNVSVTFQEKGSYRLENMLAFLDKWLDPWDAERALADDWRILMLDSYRAHLAPELDALAWSRG